MANHRIKIKTPEVDVGWVLLQQPWLKVNVDGAVFERHELRVLVSLSRTISGWCVLH